MCLEEAQHKRRDFLHMQRTSVDYALERGISRVYNRAYSKGQNSVP